MWQPKTTLLVLILAAISLRACTGTAEPSGKPLVTPVNLDPSTNLYTSPLNSARPLLLDISSSDISTPCNTPATKVTISAFETDGKNLLEPQVSFPATASACAAPPSGGVSGVAGLGPSPLSFSSQVASLQRLPNKFALCLTDYPYFTGAAIFGGGPLFSPSLITKDETLRPPAERQDVTKLLSPEIPLRLFPQAGVHYVSAHDGGGIAMDGKLLVVAGAGQGRFPVDIGLSTTSPYTELRDDVYGRVRDAFEKGMGPSLNGAKMPPTAPFELCYAPYMLDAGHPWPGQVDFMLEGGQNWTANPIKTLSRWRECFAFVRAKRPSAGMPAVVIGGYHMADRVVVFDQDKHKISFTPPLSPQINCGNSKFSP